MIDLQAIKARCEAFAQSNREWAHAAMYYEDVTALTAEVEQLRAELERVTAERDAAVEDFRLLEGSDIRSNLCQGCQSCEKSVLNGGKCRHGVCDGFKWRGKKEK